MQSTKDNKFEESSEWLVECSSSSWAEKCSIMRLCSTHKSKLIARKISRLFDSAPFGISKKIHLSFHSSHSSWTSPRSSCWNISFCSCSLFADYCILIFVILKVEMHSFHLALYRAFYLPFSCHHDNDGKHLRLFLWGKLLLESLGTFRCCSVFVLSLCLRIVLFTEICSANNEWWKMLHITAPTQDTKGSRKKTYFSSSVCCRKNATVATTLTPFSRHSLPSFLCFNGLRYLDERDNLNLMKTWNII